MSVDHATAKASATPSAKSPSLEDKQIGQNLRRIRRAKKMTQAALGEALPIPLTFQQMQKYEAGTNRISAARLLEFARILDVDIHDFFSDINYEMRETSPEDQAAIQARRVKDMVTTCNKLLKDLKDPAVVEGILTVIQLAHAQATE